jgi:putative colanic acid biosynthesis glycosyltransferase
MCTLSVVTVCFNAAATLEECIRSVATAKTTEVEYLIIDGGSTDSTLDIVRRYPDVVDVLVSERDGGIFEAMNKGVARASGDFVAFLNADDTYLPGAVEALLTAIRDEPAQFDVLYGDWTGIDAAGVAHERQADHRLRWHYRLCHQAVVARRSVFPTMPFDLQYRLCADFDLLLRWETEGKRFKHLPRPLVRFSETGSSAKQLRRSAIESMTVSVRRARFPWSLVFAARVGLYLFRASASSWARRLLQSAPAATRP